jgi:hypothetical protein
MRSASSAAKVRPLTSFIVKYGRLSGTNMAALIVIPVGPGSAAV